METLSDNTLMEKVKNGDLDKLGLLFERYKKPLFGFFYGMNRDAELCEDLVQNVFVRILRYKDSFRGDGEFRTWMFHIARNVNNDHFRKKRVTAKDSLDDWQDFIPGDENRFTELQREDDLRQLSSALAKLDPEKREVLLLNKYQEKKYREIAEELGCSESAVKVKIFRAMQDLKYYYKQMEAN